MAKLKMYILVCYFCRNYIMFKTKKYRVVACQNTEKWCKIWRGTDLCIDKWHEEFGEFFLTLESPKICTLMGPFWPKYKMFKLKKYRGIMHDYSEEWCKPWTKIDLHFHIEEFGELHCSSQKS